MENLKDFFRKAFDTQKSVDFASTFEMEFAGRIVFEAFREVSNDKRQYPQLQKPNIDLRWMAPGTIFRIGYAHQETGDWTYRWYGVGAKATETTPTLLFTPMVYDAQKGPVTVTTEKFNLPLGGWDLRRQPVKQETFTMETLEDAMPSLFTLDTALWKPSNLCIIRTGGKTNNELSVGGMSRGLRPV